MKYKEVIAAWNAQADEANNWDALGEDEKIEFAIELGRKMCKEAVDAQNTTRRRQKDEI